MKTLNILSVSSSNVPVMQVSVKQFFDVTAALTCLQTKQSDVQLRVQVDTLQLHKGTSLKLSSDNLLSFLTQ